MSRQSIFFASTLVFFLVLFVPAVQSQHAINVLSYDYALMFYGNGPSTTTGGTLLSVQTSIENCWNAILAKSPAAPYVISGYQDYMFALQVTNCYYTTNRATQYTTTFLGGLGNAAEWAPLRPPGASTSIWYHVSNLTQYAVNQATAPLPILGTSTFYSYQCIYCTAVNTSGLQDLFYETSTVNAANYLVQVLLGKLSQTFGMFAFGAFGNTFTGYSPTSGTQSAMLFPVGACPPAAISVVPCVGGVNTNPSLFAASSPYTAQTVALYRPLCSQAFSIWSPNTTQACVFDPCTYYLQLNNATACANGGTCANNYTANASPVFSCTCTSNFDPATNCTACLTGWTGSGCDVWNPCSVINPCQNGATCVNNATSGGFPQSSCTCTTGWTGATCSVWNPCLFNNTCLNGATCVGNATQGGNPSLTCSCAQGYVGTTCQTWNPCAFNNTCLNGGTCVNNATQNGIPQQTCTCAPGYVGTTCQTWNPCAFNNTCLNGGTCVNNATQNGIPQKTCTCAQGYVGATCQTWNPCAFNNTCLNGGTCVNNATQNGIPQKTCTCAQGYVGTTCQTWNPCAFNNTCLNGATCVNNATQNGIPQQTCTCAQGYTGTTCQTWNPCGFNNTCLNGGTCVGNTTQNGFPQQTCTCAQGYVGATCQTWNPCAFNNTCLNGGSCINNPVQNGVPQQTCSCAQGYVGATCQTWNPCAFNNTCLNGGTCVNNSTQNGVPQQTCTCAQGYVGATCQTWNPCSFNTTFCKNGATCNNNATQNGIPQQTCTCAPGYIGTNCQIWDPCTYYNQPCQNQGLCTNNATVGGSPLFQCSCSLGYTGQNCSVWDPCNAIPNVCPATAIGCTDSAGPVPGQPNVTCLYSSTVLADQGYRYAIASDVNGPASSRGGVFLGNAATIIQCVNMVLSTPGIPFLSGFQDAFFYYNLYASPAQCYYLNSSSMLATFQAGLGNPSSWQQLLNLQSESWFHIANLTAYSLASATLPYLQSQPQFDPVECLICPAVHTTLQSLYLASSVNAANYFVQTLGGFPDMAYAFFSSGSIPNSFFEFFPNSPNQTMMVHDSDDCPGGLKVVPCESQITSPVQSSFGIPTYNALLYRPTCLQPLDLWDPLPNGPSNSYTYCEFEPCKYYLQHNLTSCFNNGTCSDNPYSSTIIGGGTLPAFNCSCAANYTAASNCTVCSPGFVGSDCHWDPCTYYHPCSSSGTCVNSAYPLPQGSQPFLCRCTLGYVGTNCSTWDPCNSYVNPCPSGGVCTNQPTPDPSLNYTCAYDPNQLVINSFPYGVSIDEFSLENYITSGITFLGPTTSAAECINIVLARAAQLPFVVGYQDIFFHFQQYSNPPDCAYISSQGVYNELQSTVSTPGAWTSMFGQGSQTIWYHIANLTAYAQTTTFLPGIECLFCPSMQMNNEFVYYADTLQAANSYIQLLAMVPRTAISFYTLTSVPLKFGPPSPNATLGAFTVSDCPGGLQVVQCGPTQPLTFFAATLTSFAFSIPLYRPACNSSAYQVWLPEQNGGNGNGCVYDPCTYFAQRSITTCLQGGTCMDVPVSSSNPQGFTCSCPMGYNPATNCSTCAPGFIGPNCQWQPCTYYSGVCQNGGTCVANSTAGGVQPYTCTCPTGFTGTSCSVWNPCASSTCTTGSVCTANTTVGGSPSYSCGCTYGFGNGNCSIWDPCQFAPLPCSAHGTCTKNATVGTFPGFSCNCSLGYTGRNCSACDVGYVGSNCHWDACTYLGGSTALCGANGLCQSSAGPPLNYSCSCVPGYIGNGCQTWDPCVYYNNPCQNGGTCFNSNTQGAQPGYVCVCPNGYSGQNCTFSAAQSSTGGSGSTTSTTTSTTSTTTTTTAPATTTSSAPPVTTSTTAFVNTTTAAPTNSSSTTLSTGAIAGIAVGAVAGTAAVVVGGVALAGGFAAAGGVGAGAAGVAAGGASTAASSVATTAAGVIAGEGTVLLNHHRPTRYQPQQPKWKQRQRRR